MFCIPEKSEGSFIYADNKLVFCQCKNTSISRTLLNSYLIARFRVLIKERRIQVTALHALLATMTGRCIITTTDYLAIRTSFAHEGRRMRKLINRSVTMQMDF